MLHIQEHILTPGLKGLGTINPLSKENKSGKKSKGDHVKVNVQHRRSSASKSDIPGRKVTSRRRFVSEMLSKKRKQRRK